MSNTVSTHDSLQPHDERLVRVQTVALMVGLVGLVIAAFGWLIDHTTRTYEGHGQFYRYYLFGWLFFLGITLGSMGIVMLHHLVGGGWGVLVRRFAETATLTLPLLLLLFLPVMFGGLHHLYPWARPLEVAQDAILAHRSPYMNKGAFDLRILIYFAIWFSFAWLLSRGSLALDRGPNPVIALRMKRLSAAGLVIYFATMSLASVDLIMSRESHWYSSIFGFLTVVGQGLSGTVFLVLVLCLVIDRSPFREYTRPQYLNDLGNMMLMFVILWAYMHLAQMLVIWMGNTQDDIVYYLDRTHGAWKVMDAVLIIVHFFVPFFLLLSRTLKRRAAILGSIAAGILVLRLFDLFWQVTASGPKMDNNWPAVLRVIYQFVMAVSCVAGIGGIWVAGYLWILRGKPLMLAGHADDIDPVGAVGHGTRPHGAH